MYHLRKHRCMYYIFFGDKQISQGMYKQQAEKELVKLIEGLYSSSHIKYLKLARNNLPNKLVRIVGANSLTAQLLPALRLFSKIHHT